jgi:hypothetical protein
LVPVNTISNPDPPTDIEPGLRLVIAGAGFGCTTVRARSFVADPEALSETRTVKPTMLAAAGVPDKTPLPSRERPAGGAPEVMLQEYGGFPPDAVNPWVYAVPTTADGRGEAVVMDRGWG